MQDILEKAKDIEDSSCYDIGSRMSVETVHGGVYANQSVAKSYKWMIEVAPKGTTGQIRMNRQVTQPIVRIDSLGIVACNPSPRDICEGIAWLAGESEPAYI